MMRLLSKKQICMGVGCMIDKGLLLPTGDVICHFILLMSVGMMSVGLMVLLIDRGRKQYKTWKSKKILNSVFRDKRGK